MRIVFVLIVALGALGLLFWKRMKDDAESAAENAEMELEDAQAAGFDTVEGFRAAQKKRRQEAVVNALLRKEVIISVVAIPAFILFGSIISCISNKYKDEIAAVDHLANEALYEAAAKFEIAKCLEKAKRAGPDSEEAAIARKKIAEYENNKKLKQAVYEALSEIKSEKNEKRR